jgi:DNA-repair protein complementing XP-A cells
MIKIDGSKYIDSAGGFLIDERDIEIDEGERAAKIQKVMEEEQTEEVPLTYFRCIECEEEFADSYLQKNFEYTACDKCKDLDEKHELITKTNARDDYLLKDCDFDYREPPLKFIARKNPHKSTWAEMKLYLKLQVEARALEVHGSFDEIKRQKELREEKREIGKIKKYNKQLVELKKTVRATLFDNRKKAAHEHEFGPSTYNEETDEYTHVCTTCGFSETYEEL